MTSTIAERVRNAAQNLKHLTAEELIELSARSGVTIMTQKVIRHLAQTRITQEQKAALEIACEKAGLSKSVAISRLIDMFIEDPKMLQNVKVKPAAAPVTSPASAPKNADIAAGVLRTESLALEKAYDKICADTMQVIAKDIAAYSKTVGLLPPQSRCLLTSSFQVTRDNRVFDIPRMAGNLLRTASEHAYMSGVKSALAMLDEDVYFDASLNAYYLPRLRTHVSACRAALFVVALNSAGARAATLLLRHPPLVMSYLTLDETWIEAFENAWNAEKSSLAAKHDNS